MYLKALEICIFKIHELDPAKCVPAPGLAWQAALQKAKVKLDLLTDIGMLLFVERGVTVGLGNVTKASSK